MGATTVVTIESRNILGASMELPSKGLSSLLEGLIPDALRGDRRSSAPDRARSPRFATASFDPFLHEFAIHGGGIEVGDVLLGYEALLSGFGREPQGSNPTA